MFMTNSLGVKLKIQMLGEYEKNNAHKSYAIAVVHIYSCAIRLEEGHRIDYSIFSRSLERPISFSVSIET